MIEGGSGRGRPKTGPRRQGEANRRELKPVLGLAFGFAKPGDAVSGFPLPAFFQEFQAFETFQDVPFTAERGRGAQAAML